MPDPAAQATDKLIEKMEKRMNTVYSTAEKEMNRKLKNYMKLYNAENKQKKADLKAGKITKDQYNAWLEGKARKSKWLTEMVNTLSEDAAKTDMKAMSAVRGFLPEAYAVNHNFGAFEAEKGAMVKTSFTLYDAHTVERIVEERPNLLPEPKPDIPKDVRWHKQKINNAIVQGILQGEAIDDIATRLQDVTDMDRRAAIRNARTATTGAQNAGRIDSYKDAEKMGIELEQEWLATLDDRTRSSHRELDGERAEVGKKFSNGCRFPGDPSGPPEEIYNCRCTLVAAVKGIDQSMAPRFSRLDPNTDFEEWKFGKDKEVRKAEYNLKSATNRFKQIDNKTYSGIWANDVKVSDYAAKKGSIQGKKDYYNSKIDEYKDKLTLNPDDQFYKNRLETMQGYLKELNDFEKRGKEYEKYSNLVTQYKKELKAVKPSVSPFSADAYSAARKSAAHSFTDRGEADKFLRPTLDEQWKDLEDREKYGVWKYTENSNPMNKPLSGYEDTWDRSDFKGVGNADWGHEDVWRTNPTAFKQFGHSNGRVDHAEAISGLTTAIDKCELPEDMWFVRGSDENGLAGLFEGDLFSFDDAKAILQSGDIQQIKAAFEGQTFQSHAFLSTGIASDSGFSGNVKYRVYAPEGTKCIYAEPQSYYGNTISGAELYQPGKSYRNVGGEAETIFQRGTEYRVVEIEEVGWNNLKVTMEVVNQPDYFETGFEQTFDDGATSFKK